MDSNRIEPQRFSAHRPGMSENTRLLHGPEGAGSFEFSIVHSHDGYATPRHRHNFDQIRYMLGGRFGFGKSVQEPGSVGYFTEGVFYQQRAIGESDTLLLQFGGAGGDGFMQYAELERGYAELQERGEFHDGVFTWHDGAGKRHNKDAYEAIWEHVNGRPIRYPKPRYAEPVIMDPDSYAWVNGVQAGVAHKLLGRFTERSIEIAFSRTAARAEHGIGGPRLIYVLAGDGLLVQAGAERPVNVGTAAHLEAGEQATLHAENELVCYEIGLPRF